MDVETQSIDSLAALSWFVDLGADESIDDAPINRFEAPKNLPKMGPSSNIAPVSAIPNILPAEEAAPDVAALMAAKCETLDDIRNALGVFDLCALKKGARNLVFNDGLAEGRVMVIGDIPTRDDDRAGKPFQGAEGALLDKMFSAIDIGRTYTGKTALYTVCALPWRTPQGRQPTKDEIAMIAPFLQKHVEIANPDFVVLMGNTACQIGLGLSGISRLRGHWKEAFGKPCLPMHHPDALLRDPRKKRDTWNDLLALKLRLSKDE